MPDNGNVFRIILTGDSAELDRALDSVSRRISEFTAEAGRTLERLSDSFLAVGTAMSGLGLASVALGKAALEAFGRMDSLRRGLAAVAGSAQEADRQFNDLVEVAKLPGMGLEEAVKGSIRLQAIGVSADRAKEQILAFGNAIASVGGGRVELERALYGLQQLANTDFPLGEDLNIIKDAVPQVSRLLTEAFGTNRSDQLQKLGITSRQVVDTIVAGLNELPKVTGGIANAFENMGDTVDQTLSRLGAIIEDRLNISGIIEKIADSIDNLITWFENLNPVFQDMALYTAALVTALGPLLTSLGLLIKIAPTVGAAISAIGGPITLVIALVAAAATAIIANWDEVKKYFDGPSADFFTAIGDLAKQLWTALVDTFNAIKDFILGVWAVIGSDVTDLVKGDLGTVVEICQNALGIITDVFRVFGALLSGDWKGVWDGLIRILDRAFNVIISVIQGGVRAALIPLRGLFNALGADQLASGVDRALNVVNGTLEGFKVQVDGTGAAATATASAIDELADSTAKLNKEAKKTPNLVTGKKAKPAKHDKIYWEVNKSQAGTDATALAAQQLAGQTQTAMNGAFQMLKVPKAILADVGHLTAQAINEGFAETLAEGVTNALGGLAESLGEALVSGGNIIQMAGSALLSGLGGILVSLGKLAIQTGVGILAVKTALSTLNPFVAIAAGAALVAIGSAFRKGAANIAGGMGGGSSVSSAGSSGGSYFSGGSGSYGGSATSQTYVFEIAGTKLIGVLKNTLRSNERIQGVIGGSI